MTQIDLFENWTVEIEDYPDKEHLPIYLRKSYQLYLAEYANIKFVLAEPCEKINLVTLRKQRLQIKALTGLECAWYFESLNWYARKTMLQEGLPFIEKNRQVFLPFLGIALSPEKQREFQPREKVSFLTQRFLLEAIYHNRQHITVTEAAKVMNVSKMSITRCFDELEALNLSLIEKKGRTRKFVWENGPEDLWKLVSGYLRNPVIRSYALLQPLAIKKKRLGGMSAISHYTLIADNDYVTLAVTREEENELRLKEQVCLPDNEHPEMLIQVLPYELEYADNKAIDPLSAILSLTEEEKNEPRIESAIEEILEEVFNDHRVEHI